MSRWISARFLNQGRTTRRPRPFGDRPLESLEARNLLSGMTYTLPGVGTDLHAGHHQAEVRMIDSSSHEDSSGMVHKKPSFYEFYTGPKHADLNVKAASAVLKNGTTLTLTGMMQGNITLHPKSADQESYFVFGIDRGSATAITPFYQRPGVKFDAVVVVSVKADGITASVTDIVTHQKTALDPKSVHIHGKKVSVSLAASLLPTPTGGISLDKARFNLWPRSDLSNVPQANHGSFVASFIPENATAPIKVVGKAHA